MKNDDCRNILSEIANLLGVSGEDSFAEALRSALAGSEQGFDQFLISNELWGGSGSLADSAFTFDPRRPNPNKNREAFYSLMIKLCQIAAGHINVRTTLWVEAFESWQRSGLG